MHTGTADVSADTSVAAATVTLAIATIKIASINDILYQVSPEQALQLLRQLLSSGVGLGTNLLGTPTTHTSPVTLSPSLGYCRNPSPPTTLATTVAAPLPVPVPTAGTVAITTTPARHPTSQCHC